MSNINFKTIPAITYVSDADNTHYNLPFIPWFRSTQQPADYPNTFTSDIGSNHTFESNVDASSYQYIYNKTDSFWPEEGSVDNGFNLQSPSTSSTRSFNYKISGGKGHWMPCPIFKTISFFWAKEDGDGVWYMKHLALVLKNVKTDEEKIWGAGINNTNGSSRLMKITSTNEVRAMGPDWFVYGVIFNLVRPSTSAAAAPKARLVDFRLGHQCSGLGAGTHRLVVPKQMTWNNFKTAMASGQMKYEPEDVPLSTNDVKRLTTDPYGITDNTFCPGSDTTGGFYNKWVGNCFSIRMNPFNGVDLLDYIGTQSDAGILITRADNDTLIYRGSINEVSQASSTIAILSLTKLEIGGGEWQANLDMNMEITGLQKS